MAMKRDYGHSNSQKGKHLIGAGLQCRGIVHYHHGRKLDNTQAGMVLEKELRVLHPDQQAAGSEGHTWPGLSF